MRQFPEGEKQAVQEQFRRISVDEARLLIEADQAQVIDVREPSEFSTGHIPGARLLPLQTLLRQPRAYLTSDKLVFVCAVGQRSAVACEMAVALGFVQVYNVEGGMKAWTARGFAVDKG